jgi:hypothetical protein
MEQIVGFAELLTAVATAVALIVAALALHYQAETTRLQAEATRDQLRLNENQREQDRRRFASRVAVFSPQSIGLGQGPFTPDSVVARIQNRSPANITGVRLLIVYRGPNLEEHGVLRPAPAKSAYALVPLLPPCAEIRILFGGLGVPETVSELNVDYMAFTDANGIGWEMTPNDFPRELGRLRVPDEVRRRVEDRNVLWSLTKEPPLPLPDCSEGN